MDLHHLGHSTLLVSTARARVLVDPGALSTAWHDVGDVDLVVVTHQHRDHLDPEELVKYLARHTDAAVVGDHQSAELLAGHGVEAAVLRPGGTRQVGDLAIQGVGGDHAVIHPAIPTIANVGVLVAEDGGPRLLHPGDSHDAVPDGVDVLALPIAAPWTSMAATATFARRVEADHIVPIHDAILSPAGREIHVALVDRLVRGRLQDLADAGPTTL